MGFMISFPVLLTVLFAILLLNIYYSYVIINKTHNVLSRIFSVLLIWMLPFIGLVSVFLFTKIVPPATT